MGTLFQQRELGIVVVVVFVVVIIIIITNIIITTTTTTTIFVPGAQYGDLLFARGPRRDSTKG